MQNIEEKIEGQKMIKSKFLKIFIYVIIFILVFVICLLINWKWIFAKAGFYPDRSHGVSVSFIDVGKADAIFITCDDYNILIDSGEDYKADHVSSYLKRYNTKKIDLLIATHPDNDHIGGMSSIINNFDVESCWQSQINENVISQTTAYKNMLRSLETKNINTEYKKAGDTYNLGDLIFTVLSPDKNYEDTNNASLIIRLDYFDTSFLFTGDAEDDAEQDLINNYKDSLQADVLKVAHHGSNNGSSYEFLQLVSPKYAVISVGENTANLPSKACIERLESNNIEILRTDLQGTVTINAQKYGKIKVHTEK